MRLQCILDLSAMELLSAPLPFVAFYLSFCSHIWIGNKAVTELLRNSSNCTLQLFSGLERYCRVSCSGIVDILRVNIVAV